MSSDGLIPFFYKARDQKGSLVNGVIEAANLQNAREKVSALNLILVQITTQNKTDLAKKINHKFINLFNTIPTEELIVFLHQFQTAYSVGMPVLRSLELIESQTQSKALKKALGSIVEDLKQGQTLHKAFSKHPALFDNIFVNLLNAGETSGRLEELLERISVITERKAENKAKVKSALFYPKIVFFFIAVVLLVVTYFVMPKIKLFLNQIGADLPPITKMVMAFSDFCVTYWYLIIAGISGSYYAFKKFTSTVAGKYALDKLLLKTPIFGNLFIWLELNAFCFTLSTLLDSGISILDALDITKNSMMNSVVQAEVEKGKKSIEDGGTLAEGLKDSPIFPSMFVGLIAMGEETGALSKILKRISAYYKIQSDHRMDNLSKLIEPILLGIIFCIVLIIAIAVFLPIWGAAGQMKK